MLVAHVEREGVWLVDGGMARLADALCDLARSHGADFRFGQRARRIVVENGKVAGVETDEGERISSEAVIWNGDVSALADGSAGPEAARAAAPTPARDRSMSALTWAMAARVEGFPLLRHNVFFCRDTRQEFDDIFGAGRLPCAPDGLCLRPGSRRRRRARTPVRHRARVLPRQRSGAPAGQSSYRSGDAIMRASGFSPAGNARPEDRARPGIDPPHDAGGLRSPISLDTGGALRPGDARMEGVVREGGVDDKTSGTLSRRGERSSGTRDSDGGAVGPPGGNLRDAGPCFDQEVEPGGYAWWYVDAISDDRRYGLTIIAFVGSVFSPYYAWTGWRDPLDHCAVNVALYGPRGSAWAMTERRRSAVRRSRDTLAIGRTTATWNAGALSFAIDETAAPIPRPIRGRVEVRAEAINCQAFVLERQGRHWWRPLAPQTRVTVEMEAPALSWRGTGIFRPERRRRTDRARVLAVGLGPARTCETARRSSMTPFAGGSRRSRWR